MKEKDKQIVIIVIAVIAVLCSALYITSPDFSARTSIYVNPSYNTFVELKHPLDGQTYVTEGNFYLQVFAGTDAPNNEIYFNLDNDDTGGRWRWKIGSLSSSGRTVTLSSSSLKDKYRVDTNYSWYVTIWSNDILIWSNRNSKWHFDTYTSNNPPVADAGEYNVEVGEWFNLDATNSYDTDGTIVTYAWDFNEDGEYEYWDPKPTVHYEQVGTYHPKLKVWDDDGAWDTDTAIVTVSEGYNNPPVADGDGPYTAKVGETVTLDGSGSYDSDGDIVSYEWDVDNDGIYDFTGETTSFSYTSADTYTIKLRVTDDGGETGTDTTTATISEGPPPGPEGVETSAFLLVVMLLFTAGGGIVGMAYYNEKRGKNG